MFPTPARTRLQIFALAATLLFAARLAPCSEAIAQDSKGYLPLNAEDVKVELEKLDRAKTWAPRAKQGPMLNFPFPSPEPEDK